MKRTIVTVLCLAIFAIVAIIRPATAGDAGSAPPANDKKTKSSKKNQPAAVPLDSLTLMRQGSVLMQQGRYEEAMVELRHSSTGRDPELRPVLERAYTESGIQAASLVCAEHLSALSRREYVNPLPIAVFFALAGDIDRTFEWLETIYEERMPTIYTLAQPAFDPYRADPRFRDLMGRMGIPESGWEKLGGEGD